MKKQILMALALSLGLGSSLCRAQLPPVTFPAGTNLCDSTPYKLIFVDEFNGSSLDSSKWITFNSWKGMSRTVNGVTIDGDHENWSQGRIRAPFNAIIRKENVSVSNGTCKILARNETTTWQCDTCSTPVTKNLSIGTIATPYHKMPNGARNWYNSAMFEIRAKFPTFHGAWSSFYTWMGTSVNEIDIAEAWGGTYSALESSKRPRNTYNLHAWGPDAPNNPYNLPKDAAISNRFPNQSWWHWIWGNHHRQDEWHVYRCEWDSTAIKTYLDGEHINTIWKYYTYVPILGGAYYVKMPTGCTATGTPQHITEGFPYNNESESQLRIGTGFIESEKGIAGQNFTKGQMEIDWVKIYQRHPELDGHTEICNKPIPIISGPAEMCGTTAYTTVPATTGGVWGSSNNAVTFGGGPSGGAGVLVDNNPNTPYNSTVLSYTYSPGPGCPPNTVYKTISTGIAIPTVTVVRNLYLSNENFSLLVSPAMPNTTYSWKVWYGFSNSSLNYYTATGPYITTPKMTHWGIFAYLVRWELTINSPCGTKVLKGLKDNLSYTVPFAGQTHTFMEADSSAAYLETRFTADDSMRYEQTVQATIAGQFIENVNDTAGIYALINKISIEALEPYLYFGDKKPDTSISTQSAAINLPVENRTRVYPNPAKDILNVKLSATFAGQEPVYYSIINPSGRQVKEGSLTNSINISGLNNGTYILKIHSTTNPPEYIRFTRY